MKTLLSVLLAFTMSLTLIQAEDGPTQIAIGEEAPNTDQVMKDVTGFEVQLKTLNKENGLLVIFSCNTCPYVIAWEDRYNDIAAYCEANNIGLVVVNSNEARRDDADSYEQMQKKAKAMGYNFYYVLDVEHELADAFGATKTPDVFLFNADMKLAYKGAIDDSKEIETVETTYLNDAMMKLINNEIIDPNETKAIGCSIKRIKPMSK